MGPPIQRSTTQQGQQSLPTEASGTTLYSIRGVVGQLCFFFLFLFIRICPFHFLSRQAHRLLRPGSSHYDDHHAATRYGY